MTLTLYPVPGKAKSDMICRAFAAGAPRSAKGSVFFGTEGQADAFRKAKSSGEPWYYVDNSFFDKHRGIYFRVTKNALQVDPRNKTSDGKRFAKLGISINPWRQQRGSDILVVPQSDQFMKSTIGVEFGWAEEIVATLKGWELDRIRRIRVRPWNRDKLQAGQNLLIDLPNLHVLVTFSSASAITAMLEGIPAISTSPTSAAHWLTGPLTRESVLDPPTPGGRLQFAQILADNQATLEEFRSGKAWAMLEGQ